MKNFSLLVMVLYTITSFAQLSLDSTAKSYVIDFDNTVSGINNGTYAGSGFTASPAAGQLDSDGVRFTGMTSPDSINFGGTANTTGTDAARGTSTGNPGTLGYYAFDTGGGDVAFGWTCDKSTYDPGIIIIRIQNNTGKTLQNITYNLDIKSFNNDTRNSTVAVRWSTDSLDYTRGAINHTTGDVAGWFSTTYVDFMTGLTIADGDYIYLRFENTHPSGGHGARDDVAIDNLTFLAYSEDYAFDGSDWIPSEPTGSLGASDAFVDAGATATLITSTTLNRVTVAPGASLFVNAGLTVNDTLFVEASASGQGQVQGSVTGTTQFQSYLSSATTRWFNFAAPVNGALSELRFDNGGFIQTLSDVGGDNSKVNIWYYDETLDNAGEGTWIPAPDQLGAADAKGWSLYLGAPYFGSLPVVVKSHGTLNNGAQTIPITQTGVGAGYNFIGNPIAASIDFDGVYTANSAKITNTYYIYDDEAGGYISYSATLGTPASRRYIGPGQAFFIQSTVASDNLNISVANQTMAQAIDIAKSVSHSYLQLNVVGSSGKVDRTYIALKSGAIDNFTPSIDGRKMINPANDYPNIYSVLGGEEYVFKFIDQDLARKSVPLYFNMDVDDNVTLDAAFLNLDPGIKITLEDKLSGDMTDLSTDSYTFRHLAANASDRFVVHFDQSAVSLAEFDKGKLDLYIDYGTLRIEGDLSRMDEVLIYDLSGKIVLQETLADVNDGIDISGLKNAIYVVSFSLNGNLVNSQKINIR